MISHRISFLPKPSNQFCFVEASRLVSLLRRSALGDRGARAALRQSASRLRASLPEVRGGRCCGATRTEEDTEAGRFAGVGTAAGVTEVGTGVGEVVGGVSPATNTRRGACGGCCVTRRASRRCGRARSTCQWSPSRRRRGRPRPHHRRWRRLPSPDALRCSSSSSAAAAAARPRGCGSDLGSFLAPLCLRARARTLSFGCEVALRTRPKLAGTAAEAEAEAPINVLAEVCTHAITNDAVVSRRRLSPMPRDHHQLAATAPPSQTRRTTKGARV